MSAKGKIRRLARSLFRCLPPLYTLWRLRVALAHFRHPFKHVLIWLVRSKEDTNFTYDLSEANKLYLASFVSQVTGVGVPTVQDYIEELEADESLRSHIKRLVCASNLRRFTDEQARYGRRLGWYAFARAVKPRVVVETGVDKGLGSCVLAAALMRNAEEGSRGIILATDIDPTAGYLFRRPYSEFGKILLGDSVASLQALSETIDLFIHDSLHSADYERKEYEAIKRKLSKNALVISDNAHVTTALWEFARSTGRRFLFFQEKPADHWYPGAGIGVAFTERPKQ